MKGSVCLLEFKKIATKCKLHGLWVTLRNKISLLVRALQNAPFSQVSILNVLNMCAGYKKHMLMLARGKLFTESPVKNVF